MAYMPRRGNSLPTYVTSRSVRVPFTKITIDIGFREIVIFHKRFDEHALLPSLLKLDSTSTFTAILSSLTPQN